jgi:hypothetical protein
MLENHWYTGAELGAWPLPVRRLNKSQVPTEGKVREKTNCNNLRCAKNLAQESTTHRS